METRHDREKWDNHGCEIDCGKNVKYLVTDLSLLLLWRLASLHRDENEIPAKKRLLNQMILNANEDLLKIFALGVT